MFEMRLLFIISIMLITGCVNEKNNPSKMASPKKNLLLLESGKARMLTKRMYENWTTSNYQFFEHYADWCECMETVLDRKYMKRLIDDRNVNMAEKIDQLHASGKSVFVAVGSLHMFGDQALPKLMHQRSYRVEAVHFH